MFRTPELDVHVHAFSQGCGEVARMLAFRDQVRRSDEDRLRYEAIKREFAFHVASLYPTLYRMEEKVLIEGRWVEKAGQRRRGYYRITAAGRRALASQRSHWEGFIAALNRVARVKRAEA